MAEETPAARAAAGATRLDTERPGWAAEIDLGTLQLNHWCRDILGQLYKTYDDGVIALGLDLQGAIVLGFVITTATQELEPTEAAHEAWRAEYEQLDIAWHRLVEERTGSRDLWRHMGLEHTASLPLCFTPGVSTHTMQILGVPYSDLDNTTCPRCRKAYAESQ